MEIGLSAGLSIGNVGIKLFSLFNLLSYMSYSLTAFISGTAHVEDWFHLLLISWPQ